MQLVYFIFGYNNNLWLEVPDLFKTLSLLAAQKHQVTEGYADAYVVELCVILYFRILKVP